MKLSDEQIKEASHKAQNEYFDTHPLFLDDDYEKPNPEYNMPDMIMAGERAIADTASAHTAWDIVDWLDDLWDYCPNDTMTLIKEKLEARLLTEGLERPEKGE